MRENRERERLGIEREILLRSCALGRKRENYVIQRERERERER